MYRTSIQKFLKGNKEELKEIKLEIKDKDITAEAPDALPDFIIK